MKFLFWEIHRNPYAIARLEWLIYKIFGIKRMYPCGRKKKEDYLCCCQPMDLVHCDVINTPTDHKVICKLCGHTHMSSSHFIDASNETEWFDF